MNWDYARHYSRFHPDTPDHDVSLQVILRRWLGPHLPADRAANVLDVGCGRGYALMLLRDLGYKQIAGIDPDAGQVDFAQGRGLAVSQASDSAGFLRARPASYDLVLLMDVLEHLPDATQCDLLTAIRESLRPGGRLICTVPNAASAVASYWRYIDYTHRTAFTRESLESLLSQCHWRVDQIEPAEFFARPRFLFWVPTQRAIQWWLLRLHRLRWRFAYLAELGLDRGWDMPLSLNLLAVATRE